MRFRVVYSIVFFIIFHTSISTFASPVKKTISGSFLSRCSLALSLSLGSVFLNSSQAQAQTQTSEQHIFEPNDRSPRIYEEIAVIESRLKTQEQRVLQVTDENQRASMQVNLSERFHRASTELLSEESGLNNESLVQNPQSADSFFTARRLAWQKFLELDRKAREYGYNGPRVSLPRIHVLNEIEANGAEKFLLEFKPSAPDDYTVFFTAANAALERGELRAAVYGFQRGLELYPQGYSEGRTFFCEGGEEKAFVDAWISLTFLYHQLGFHRRYLEAVRVLRSLSFTHSDITQNLQRRIADAIALARPGDLNLLNRARSAVSNAQIQQVEQYDVTVLPDGFSSAFILNIFRRFSFPGFELEISSRPDFTSHPIFTALGRKKGTIELYELTFDFRTGRLVQDPVFVADFPSSRGVFADEQVLHYVSSLGDENLVSTNRYSSQNLRYVFAWTYERNGDESIKLRINVFDSFSKREASFDLGSSFFNSDMTLFVTETEGSVFFFGPDFVVELDNWSGELLELRRNFTPNDFYLLQRSAETFPEARRILEIQEFLSIYLFEASLKRVKASLASGEKSREEIKTELQALLMNFLQIQAPDEPRFQRETIEMFFRIANSSRFFQGWTAFINEFFPSLRKIIDNTQDPLVRERAITFNAGFRLATDYQDRNPSIDDRERTILEIKGEIWMHEISNSSYNTSFLEDRMRRVLGDERYTPAEKLYVLSLARGFSDLKARILPALSLWFTSNERELFDTAVRIFNEPGGYFGLVPEEWQDLSVRLSQRYHELQNDQNGEMRSQIMRLLVEAERCSYGACTELYTNAEAALLLEVLEGKYGEENQRVFLNYFTWNGNGAGETFNFGLLVPILNIANKEPVNGTDRLISELAFKVYCGVSTKVRFMDAEVMRAYIVTLNSLLEKSPFSQITEIIIATLGKLAAHGPAQEVLRGIILQTDNQALGACLFKDYLKNAENLPDPREDYRFYMTGLQFLWRNPNNYVYVSILADYYARNRTRYSNFNRAIQGILSDPSDFGLLAFERQDFIDWLRDLNNRMADSANGYRR